MNEFEEWKKENWNTLKKINPYPYSNLLQEGWRAAFENMENWIRGRRCTGEDMLEYIYKELDGNH